MSARAVAAVLALGLVVAIAACVLHYGAARYQAGHDAAVAERAAVDAAAVLKRTRDNAAVIARQAETNSTITLEKDHEIADLRRRLAAAPRMRIGPAVCPDRPAARADSESATGGDRHDPSSRVVSARADADLKQLIEAVETDLATGRACQRFLSENGLVP